MSDQRFLVAYPVMLLYGCFALFRLVFVWLVFVHIFLCLLGSPSKQFGLPDHYPVG